jgi:predicted transcriptional regulator
MTTVAGRRLVALHAVATVPGSHLRALQRISRLSFGTLRYHLDALVDERLVAQEADRRYLRYYPFAMPRDARRIWDALRLRQTRAVVQELLHEPGLPQAGVARRLALPPASVNMYVRRLRELGLVWADGPLQLSRPDAVKAIMQGIRPTFLDDLTDGAVDLFDQL